MRRKNRFFGGKGVRSMLYSRATRSQSALVSANQGNIHQSLQTSLPEDSFKPSNKAAHRIEMKIREKGSTDTVEIP